MFTNHQRNRCIKIISPEFSLKYSRAHKAEPVAKETPFSEVTKKKVAELIVSEAFKNISFVDNRKFSAIPRQKEYCGSHE